MKILVVSINHEHANEMTINNLHGLLEVAQVDFFGPGYSTSDELEHGLKDYWSRGKYDALILDFAFAMLQLSYLDIYLAYHWHRYFMSDYSIYESIRYADKIVEEAKEIDNPKLLRYYFDTISISESWLECVQELLDAGFILWGLGEEFTPQIVETEDTKAIGWSNRYSNFIRKNKEKVISTPWAVVVYREFYAGSLEKRKYDITVPGNLSSLHYPDREKIIEAVKETKYKIYDNYDNRTLAYRDDEKRIANTLYYREEDRILDEKLKSPCIYLDSKIRREAIAFWRENYNVGLRSSKMGYADGGLSKQVVRKYFEIPARGTLLLCQDVPPLKNLGFNAWENMVPVTPDSLLDVCNYLFVNPDKMQDIATTGRRLVFEKHTAPIHAKHVIDAIETIKNGRFNGSYWFDGEFYIN